MAEGLQMTRQEFRSHYNLEELQKMFHQEKLRITKSRITQKRKLESELETCSSKKLKRDEKMESSKEGKKEESEEEEDCSEDSD